jgi:hypothetical protein
LKNKPKEIDIKEWKVKKLEMEEAYDRENKDQRFKELKSIN